MSFSLRRTLSLLRAFAASVTSISWRSIAQVKVTGPNQQDLGSSVHKSGLTCARHKDAPQQEKSVVKSTICSEHDP
jgi:hypothetical protein